MKKNNSTKDSISVLRYGMIVPLTLLMASVISCSLSYSSAKQSISDDLNCAMLAIVNENCGLWTSPDTIAALRQMHETTHKPLIYQVSDVNFSNPALKDKAYFALTLVDKKNMSHKIEGKRIITDSIILVPEFTADDPLAIQVQGFADCSMASLFSASDQTLPGILLTLSILSMTSVIILRRKDPDMSQTQPTAPSATKTIERIKLTPMQRQLVQLLLDAPDMKVEKKVLCEALWDNKSNAAESLYTLVRRTKSALAKANIDIICNRGDSYSLHIND